MKSILLVITILFLAMDADSDARKANQAFEDGRYEEAVELYDRAISENPDNPKLYFNKASALYKLGRTEEAMQSFERYEGMVENPVEQSLADYNQGTMLTDQEEYQQAAELFREALKKNPEDEDARHNYELALRRQQEQEQQQQEQQQQDSNQEEQSNEQQQNQQQQQDGENERDQNQQQQQPQDQPQNPEDQGEQQPSPTQMTPEEAENILDALAQLERKLLEDMKKESEQTQSQNEKDW
jgi:Ca-activated chloride channel family protein